MIEIKTKQNPKLLTQILNWDLGEITNFAILENPSIPSEKILQATKEYKYYMYLVMITDESLTIPTAVVDAIWHAHILHTKDYINFCETLAGHYIHHTPRAYDETEHQLNNEDMSILSKEVFGNIVFDFSKQNLVKTINFHCR